jgi:acyl-[acyl-carrier-protein] desaturase
VKKISTHLNNFLIQHNELVFTAADYVDIMQKLIDKWEIDKISGLTDEAST